MPAKSKRDLKCIRSLELGIGVVDAVLVVLDCYAGKMLLCRSKSTYRRISDAYIISRSYIACRQDKRMPIDDRIFYSDDTHIVHQISTTV